MKIKICLSLISIVLAAVFFAMPAVSAADYENIEQSLYIWRLINDVRQNPVQSLSALGIDVNSARAKLGDEDWILDRKLPPLAFNMNLFDSAQAHNKNMIISGYFDYISSSAASSLNFRILFYGYNALDVGESIGALTFDTYRDSFDSAKVIFVNMIKDELFADPPRNYRIFSDVFTETGISMQSGNLAIDNGISKRAYVVVMNFGRPIEKRSYIIGNTIKDDADMGLFDMKSAVGGVKIVFHDAFKGIDQTVSSTQLLGSFQFLKQSSGYMVLKAVNQDGSCSGLEAFWTVDGNELHDLKIDN